jgi:hypothetical protein
MRREYNRFENWAQMLYTPKRKGAAMNFLKNILPMTLLAVLVVLFLPLPVHAYIDPGTGSYVFQIIIAAFVAVSFMVKAYWHKIKAFFSRLFAKKSP